MYSELEKSKNYKGYSYAVPDEKLYKNVKKFLWD